MSVYFEGVGTTGRAGVESAVVRRDWPDGRHDFVGFTMSRTDAERVKLRGRVLWRRRRLRPVHSVVDMSLVELLSHRGLCRRTECPSPGVGVRG